MLYLLGVVIVLVIVLLLFLYSIWKDEEHLEKIESQIGKSSDKDILLSMKTSFVDPEVFKVGLTQIDFQQEDFINLKRELNKKIIGMNNFVNSIIVNLLAGGHLLVEGVPGLAKTKTIETLSEILDMDFKRIQFTPDMMPSDIVGVEIFNSKTREFQVKKGPVFSNIVLADEVNRTTPKVQSALLESMEERKVSIGGVDYKLPSPFFVLATQNPLEQEGTYNLPEAQVDRFMFKILVDYPTNGEEKLILNTLESEESIKLNKVMTAIQIAEIQNYIRQITASDSIKDYITRLVMSTRVKTDYIQYGASPRASIGLLFASKALAYLEGRDYVTHEDVQRLALNVMRHRIMLSYDAKVDGFTEDGLLLEMLTRVTLE